MHSGAPFSRTQSKVIRHLLRPMPQLSCFAAASATPSASRGAASNPECPTSPRPTSSAMVSRSSTSVVASRTPLIRSLQSVLGRVCPWGAHGGSSIIRAHQSSNVLIGSDHRHHSAVSWVYDQQVALHYREIIRCERRYVADGSPGDRLRRDGVWEHPAIDCLEPGNPVVVNGPVTQIAPRQLFLGVRKSEHVV